MNISAIKALNRLCCLLLGVLLSSLATHQAQAQQKQLPSNKAVNKSAVCDLQLLAKYENAFDKLLLAKARQDAKDVDIRRVARLYIDQNIACFDTLYAQPSKQQNASQATNLVRIDDGGLWFDANTGERSFRLGNTKWGANSPFFPSGGGQNANGPGSSGGVVTYSFIDNGVSHAAEQEAGEPEVDANLAYSSLPNFSSCFETEITRAFAAWSAVADIQFREVSDDGTPTDSFGAIGDIRIGAHSFDGTFGILAHAFFPPPNGATVAGDVHFDRAESWACTPSNGVIDIGIIAIHEFGHAIGLQHEEQGARAIMNPLYDPNIATLTVDDIAGAISIYGSAEDFEALTQRRRLAVVAIADDMFVIPIPSRTTPLTTPEECTIAIGNNPSGFVTMAAYRPNCISLSRNLLGTHFGRFFTFSHSTTRAISIDLGSDDTDTYLYVLDNRGNIIEINDDGGVGFNSRLNLTLPAGDYIIEATTFGSNETGNFVLTVD